MMQTCRQCQTAFEITPDDLAFYDQVSPIFNDKKELIPPPTHCPDCRFVRRTALRNERKLYRRTCDATGESIISMFPASSPYTVYANDAWWSDRWDGVEFGRAIDFSRPFFAQFGELSRKVPRVALLNPKAENSPYCNFADANKNCHLVINSNFNEDCYYSTIILSSKSCCDNLWVISGELCYECTDCEKCYNVRFSRESNNCSDAMFLSDCRGCTQCIGCVNLRNKRLHVFNKPVAEQEYQRMWKELQTRGGLEKFRATFEAFRLTQPHPASRNISSENVQGEHLLRCKNARRSFEMYDCEDCAYCDIDANLKNCWDCNSVDHGELSLENTSLMGHHHCFTAFCRDSSDLFYCWDCHASHDLFGCIGLRHKQYCILNTQYTKEEYERLVPKLIEHMRNAGEWGEFFPVEISPFAYNETVAQEYFPLAKEEVLKRGWTWREEKDDVPKVAKTIPASQLPDAIDGVPDDIVNWAISCEVTNRPFKIIKQELDFYRKMQLPVPHIHSDERHRRRMALRSPRKLWMRSCAKCGNEMQTTSGPNRPEIVYCERCYLETVY